MKAATVFAFKYVIPIGAMVAFVAACWQAMGHAFEHASSSYTAAARGVRRAWLYRRLGLVESHGSPPPLPRRPRDRRKLIHDDRGVAAVEFALISVPFVMLVGLGVDGVLGSIARAQLVFAVQQAAIESAGGSNNWSNVFAGNVSAPEAAISCDHGRCTGSSVYVPIFGGLFAVTSIPMSVSATAAVRS